MKVNSIKLNDSCYKIYKTDTSVPFKGSSSSEKRVISTPGSNNLASGKKRQPSKVLEFFKHFFRYDELFNYQKMSYDDLITLSLSL